MRPLQQLAATILVGFLLLAAALPTRAAEVERVVSPGGIEAWLVQDHSNPIIAMNIAFRGGAALDPDGKEGLANMASATSSTASSPWQRAR